MTNAEYHAMPGISKSGLDLINKSPAHYKWAQENPSEPTAAMRIGTLTHLATLEPDRFNSECIVMPTLDRRTKDGKLRWEEFQANHPDQELLTSDEHTRITAIRDAVRAHSMARKLLDRIAQVEVSTFWKDEGTGVDCRCRPDGILDNGMLIDLKTTADAGRGFERSVRQYRYHVQAAFYAMGMAGAPMIFINLLIGQIILYFLFCQFFAFCCNDKPAIRFCFYDVCLFFHVCYSEMLIV